MKAKKILFTAILFVLNLFAQSQTNSFYETISLPRDGGIADIVKTPDKKLISISRSDTDACIVVKVDTTGNILWQKELKRVPPRYGYPMKVIVTTDGAIIVVTEMVISGHAVISIVKLDQDGNFVWAKRSEYGSSKTCDAITASENGGFAIVANGCTWGNTITSFSGAGDVLWQTLVPSSYSSNILFGILHKNDNNLIVSGMTGNGNNNHLCLYSIDASGNLVWYKTYLFPEIVENFGIRASLDGGYILTGNTKSMDYNESHAFLLHTDNTGNLLWAKKYDHSLNTYSAAVIQFPDSDYVLTGSIFYPHKSPIDNQMLNIKTDKNGNPVWVQSFGNALYNGGGFDNLTCSEWLEGDHFYTAGSGENSVIIKNSAITGTGACTYDTVNLIAVSLAIQQEDHPSNCTITTRTLYTDTFSSVNTDYVTHIYCPTEADLKDVPGRNIMAVYPNPFYYDAVIEFGMPVNETDLEIFDIQGAIVRELKGITGNSVIFHRDDLPGGYYFIRLIKNEKVISAGKFVIIE